MHEVGKKYKNRKILKVLVALGEDLGCTVVKPEKQEIYHIHGVPVQSGNPKIDMRNLKTVFTGQDINAKILRESVWQRKSL